MKRSKQLMIGALSAALLAAGGCASSDDDNQTLTSDSSSNYRLQLLHFSDVDGNEQSALDSVDEFSALVEVFRNDPTYGENTLFVSSGDHIIQGPRFYAAEQGTVTAVTGSNEPGHADIAMMNAMGVQAAAVGNHELDANPGEFADAIKADGQATAVFPHLASNIDFSGESGFVVGTDGTEASELAGTMAKYSVVTINGERIGLVGASTPTLPTITTTGDLVVTPGTSASVAELAAVIQPSVDALKLAGVNKIILLAHMQQIAVEKQLATLLDGVDIIVAGGSNTRMGDSNDALFAGTYVTDDAFAESYPFQAMGADGNPTLVVNVDADYKYLGRLVVEFDSNGKIDLSRLDETVNGAYAATTSMVSSLGGTPNAEVVEIRDALQSVIDAQYGNIMGYTSVYLDGRRSQVRTEETNLGYLSNAANLWYAEQVSGETVDIALKNGGGIRSEIGSAIVPPGSTDYADAVLSPPEGGGVSEGHLKATMRFDNSLVLVTVSSTELKDLLEHGVSATTVGATPGQFPQVGGMRFSFDPSRTARTAQGNGDRIRDLQILHDNGTLENVVADGAVVDPSRTFRLVTLNFLADGGDNYPFDTLAAANRMDLDNASQIGGADPGLQSSFSKLGGEQDALAEYLLAFHPISAPYDRAETSAEHDYHVVNLSEQTSARVVDLNSQTLQLRQVGRHESGLALDTGASEIVAFDSTTNRVFVINASASTVDVLALEADGSLTEVDTINGSAITGGISVGGFNSVDAKNGLIAVAVEAETQTDPGAVAFFDASTLNLIHVVTVGALPDAVTFTPDGTKVIVSNEGQPSEDYTIDPVGSISIVDVSNGAALATVTTLGFEDYNTGGSKTLPEGVRVFGPNASVAQDMEPEYAAVSADSSTAWVTLQENNAVAIVDLVNNTLEVKALGFKDHSLAGNELDVSDRDDAINLQNWPIYGMYMPDSISSFAVGGSTYYVTANEGDARDYAGFSEEDRIKDLTLDSIAFPTAAALQADDQLGRLTVTNTLGDTDGDGDFDELYAFGARSFSIWNSSGTLVFDSGSDLERITASRFPTYFNLSNDDNSAGDFDSRSDAKGPEPEAAVVGEVNGVTYAFIGLERIGGIVVYDVSNPTNPTLAGYFNNRDFGTELTPTTGGDAGPEGFEFVSAADSPTGKALLIVGNEISGTTTVYEIDSSKSIGAEFGTIGTITALIAEASTADDPEEYSVDGQGGDTNFPYIGRMKALATVGEKDKNTGKALTGYPDGNAAWLVDDDTVRVAYQSESYGTMSHETYTWEMNSGVTFTGSHIHTIDYNRAAFADFLNNEQDASTMFEGSGHLFHTIYNQFGEEVTAKTTDPADLGGKWGNQTYPTGELVSFADSMKLTTADFFFNSFCGAYYEKANKYGSGIGFADDVWIAAEEWNISSMFSGTSVDTNDTMGLASVVVDIANETAYTVPALGQAGYEKILPINPKHSDYVVLVLAGYNHYHGVVPLRIYVGKKGVDENNQVVGSTASARDQFLARNGLLYGKIYGLALANDGFAGLGISNDNASAQMMDDYLDNEGVPETFSARFYPTSYQWQGWENPVSVGETEIKRWSDPAEQPTGYTFFNGNTKIEHPAVDPDITKQRFVQNMTNMGAMLGFELTNFLNEVSGGDLPAYVSTDVTRIMSALDGSLTLETGYKGIGHTGIGTAARHLEADSFKTVQPDGLQWIKTSDADVLVVDEDSGNDFGERKYALVLDPTDLTLKEAGKGYFLAMAGGSKNPRAANQVAVYPGTFSRATSSEFSGSWNVTALVTKKADGSFYSKAELAGTQEQVVNQSVPLTEARMIGVVQHAGESGGAVSEREADQGGQIFMFNFKDIPTN